MEQLLETARAYLDTLEADRQAALTLSEQKAEEAKLIKARQEGFRAAIEMLGGEIATGDVGTDPHQPVQRRVRRPIREMILRELSFCGHEMTTAQIAKAIDYIPERTETALERLERNGQVLRNEGRWTIGTTPLAQPQMAMPSEATAVPKKQDRSAQKTTVSEA
jgi:methionine aminopeptidase